MQDKDHKVAPLPTSRRIVFDAGRLGTRRHIIHGLLEFDVTCARQAIGEHKRKTGESLSRSRHSS